MVSLRAVLGRCGILLNLEKAMDELDVPDKKIKDLQYQIGQLVLDVLVEAGRTVVDDFEA